MPPTMILHLVLSRAHESSGNRFVDVVSDLLVILALGCTNN